MRKKILAFVLCVCLVVSMLPIVANAAIDKIYVGGVQVTEENASNITGPGITLGEGGRVSYNFSTRVLTLDNATITGYYNRYDDVCNIYGGDDLKIELKNNNEIIGTHSEKGGTYGIYSGDSLTFIGEGTLRVTAGTTADSNWVYAIGTSFDNLVIDDVCTIIAVGNASAGGAIFAKTIKIREGSEVIVSESTTGTPSKIYTRYDDSYGLEDYKYTVIRPATSPVYSVSSNVTETDFGSVTEGYTGVSKKTITVTNDGNQEITLTKPNAVNFAVSDLSKNTLAAGESATFTITPKDGLTAGTYKETVTVQGANGTNQTNAVAISVSFVVNKQVSTSTPASSSTPTPTTTPTPTLNPTVTPTDVPTEAPTEAGTEEVTLAPTEEATASGAGQEPTTVPTQTPDEEQSFPWIVVVIAVVIMGAAAVLVISKKKK